MSDELAGLDALAQADLVRRHEVKAVEAVDAAITRIEAVNPTLNALIHERFDKARAEAAAGPGAGPLEGVPIVVKDLDGMLAGEPYYAGSEHLRRAGYVAGRDSWFHARLKAAGAIILGRTNTPELGLIPTTEPATYGPTRNPWDTTRSPGGSSGGSAALVASRAVAVAHAGDGGGSIRIPASACGLVGLLPSRGRTSLGPEAAENWGGWVRRHVVTRSVRDSAAILDVVHGWLPGDLYTAPTPAGPFLDAVGSATGRLRVGVLRAAPDPTVAVHPACLAALDHAAGLLAHAGHDVFDQDGWPLAEPDRAAFGHNVITCFASYAAADVADLGRLTGEPVTAATVQPDTWALAEVGRAIAAPDLVAAQHALHAASRDLARWWGDGNDLLLTPTMATPPAELGRYDPQPDNPMAGLGAAGDTVAFTIPFNVTGQPAISLPLFWDDEGLPIGVQLVAAYGREDLLLAVAAQLEAAAPWADRLPEVHA